jgi:hypothetical protein
MTLGDVLARLDDDGATAEFLLGIGGLTLLASTRERANESGTDLASYVRAVVQRYAASASDEEWLTVMGIIGRAPDPGLAYVRRAIEFASRGERTAA